MSINNQVRLIGHLGKDPELRYTTSGQPCLRFRLATTDRWKDDQGVKQERTEWHSVVAWNKRAEGLSRLLRKGSKVCLDGQLRTRSWEKDGVTRYVTEVHMNDIDLLTPQGQHGGDDGHD